MFKSKTPCLNLLIAYNEGKVDIHAIVKVMVDDVNEEGEAIKHLVETSVGRVIVNQLVPREMGYINKIISKKSN